MRHQVDGRKFGRNTSHRKAMFRNLANSVIHHEQVVTTAEKAKETRRVIDRLITLAKKGTPAARRLAFDRTRDNDVVSKLFGTLVDRYKARPGGYTRVLRLADRRWGDAAEMAVLELVDHPPIDRARKVKMTAEGEVAAPNKPVAADPFAKMRKVFSGGKSTAPQAAKAPKAPKAEKKAKKAPAAKKAK